MAHSKKKIGNTYFSLKNYHQSLLWYQEALLLFKKYQEQESAHTTSIWIDLGELYLVQGDLPQALYYLQQSCHNLGEACKIEQADYQEVTRCLLLIGDHYKNRGEVMLAHSYYRRALALARQELGADHPLSVCCSSLLGDSAPFTGAIVEDD